MSKSTERSRAYPVLSLEDGGRAVAEILRQLGSGSFSREVLAEVLGHSNAHGGPGARKIAALAQYGLLRRRARRYSPTALAERVAGSSARSELQAALRQALGRPPLFRELLERYGPQGRLPGQLADVLWRDHGITRKASRFAAEIFRKSARYAGVLDSGGAFLRVPGEGSEVRGATAHGAPSGVASPPPDAPAQRFEFALTAGRVAKLRLPLELSRKDLEIVRRQVDLLEYQVTEED